MAMPRLPPDQQRDIHNVVEAYSHKKLLLENSASPTDSSCADNANQTSSSMQTRTSLDSSSTNSNNKDKLNALNARQQQILKEAEDAVRAADPNHHRLHDYESKEEIKSSSIVK